MQTPSAKWTGQLLALLIGFQAVAALSAETNRLQLSGPMKLRTISENPDSTALQQIPASDSILSKLKKGHPRLLASSNDFAELKARIKADPFLAGWHSKLISEGEKLLSAEPSKYEIPDGLRLLATSRRVMSRVYTLSLLYKLDGREEFASRAWKELEAAAHFPDWNTKHFLDTAEMTHAFAIAYDWLYDYWSADQRKTLATAMVEKGLKPALQIYEPPKGWARAHHNWNQVCNGGIGMGALALGDVEPDLCSRILKAALESLPLAMREFGPDGAWNEGPGYWAYATMYNVVFLAGLQSALGTDFGLSDIPGFSQTGLFPLYMAGPIDRTFNYADGGDRAIHGAQLFWFGRRFNQPVLAWYERQASSPSALDLLWYEPRGAKPTAKDLPLDRYYRAAEVVTMRSEWGDRDALFVGFKAGDNKANHSHLDVGSFVFDALGVRWATDLGADDYNLPGYFGGQRWNYYRLRAEGQNTLVINPGAGPDQDPKAATVIRKFESTANRAFAIADLSPAYAAHAERVQRGVALLNRNALLLQDEVQATRSADIW